MLHREHLIYPTLWSCWACRGCSHFPANNAYAAPTEHQGQQISRQRWKGCDSLQNILRASIFLQPKRLLCRKHLIHPTLYYTDPSSLLGLPQTTTQYAAPTVHNGSNRSWRYVNEQAANHFLGFLQMTLGAIKARTTSETLPPADYFDYEESKDDNVGAAEKSMAEEPRSNSPISAAAIAERIQYTQGSHFLTSKRHCASWPASTNPFRAMLLVTDHVNLRIHEDMKSTKSHPLAHTRTPMLGISATFESGLHAPHSSQNKIEKLRKQIHITLEDPMIVPPHAHGQFNLLHLHSVAVLSRRNQ